LVKALLPDEHFSAADLGIDKVQVFRLSDGGLARVQSRPAGSAWQDSADLSGAK
jgi:hypothetical protein